MATAINKQTGEILVLGQDGQWAAPKMAQNPQTGEKLYLDPDGGWKPSPGPAGGRASSGSGLFNTAVNNFTFGLSDEVAAAGAATGRFLRNATDSIGLTTPKGEPVSPGQAYDRTLAADRQSMDKFAADNPVAAPAIAIASGVASATPARAVQAVVQPFFKTAAKGAGQAAVAGGVAGFGSAEGGTEERLVGAGIGAGAGATLATVAPLVVNAFGKVAGKAADVSGMRNPETFAMNKIIKAFEDDGVPLGEARRRLETWAAQGGKPAMLFDLGGESVKRLARSSAGVPGPGSNTAVKAIAARQEGQTARVSDDIAATFSGNRDFHGTADALNDARKTAAAPLYERAYEKGEVWSDTLESIVGRPSMKQALGRAYKIAAEEGRDPRTLGLDLNEAGDVIFTAKRPTMHTLDYVKRGLDDVVEQFRDKTTGKLVLDEAGRAINNTRTIFRNELRTLNPDYATALDSYSGPSQSLDALHLGRRLFAKGNDAEVTAKRIADMPEGDREFFRAGVARAIKDKLDETPDGADVVKRFFGKPGMRDKLRAAFDNPRDFAMFEARMRRESEAYANQQFVSPRTGSQTNQRGNEAADLANDPTVGVVANLLRGDLVGAAQTGGTAAMRRFQGVNKGSANALAERLFTMDPRENARILAALRSQGTKNRLLEARLQGVGGNVRAGIGAAAGVLTD